MTSAEIYELMENPSLLSLETLPQLKQLVVDFPFFQTAKILYLKNLSVVNDLRFPAKLKKMSVYISDRRKLFTLIEGDRYKLPFVNESIEPVSDLGAFSLIDDFLDSRKEGEDIHAETSLLFQPSVSSDYVYWALNETALSSDTDTESELPFKLHHHELIDNFIKSDEQRPGTGLIPVADDSLSAQEDELLVPPSERDDNSFFTETLARIYIKQKRYEKALQIIKNLSLKYPEKNIYFADQIRFLEKLIINTKK